MRNLTWDEFADAAGCTYDVAVGDAQHALLLEKAEPLASAGREGGSFRLEFLGPVDPVLPQGIYPFRREAEPGFEVFIVPVGREPAGTRYEAIFY